MTGGARRRCRAALVGWIVGGGFMKLAFVAANYSTGFGATTRLEFPFRDCDRGTIHDRHERSGSWLNIRFPRGAWCQPGTFPTRSMLPESGSYLPGSAPS